jgi:hypothetical protein
VLVVAGAPEKAPVPEGVDLESLFAELTAQGLTRRAAVKECARRLGIPARDAYRRLLIDQ